MREPEERENSKIYPGGKDVFFIFGVLLCSFFIAWVLVWFFEPSLSSAPPQRADSAGQADESVTEFRQVSSSRQQRRERVSQVYPADEMYEALLEELNAVRRRHGLSELKFSMALTAGMQAHVDDMVRRDYFSHVSPEGSQPVDRVLREAPRAIVFDIRENIYSLKSNRVMSMRQRVKDATDGWMNSPGHRENMLNPDSTHVGFGVASQVGEDGVLIEKMGQLFGVDAGFWRHNPQRMLDYREPAWVAELKDDQIEFFLADLDRPIRPYNDPSNQQVTWRGGVPLLLERRENLYFLNFPELETGNYMLRVRRLRDEGYYPFMPLKVP